MKNSDELMLIPHEEGFRAWRVRGKTVAQLEMESKSRKGAEWVALPARNVVSVPLRFQGVDASRREAAAQLELEAAGLSSETAETFNYELHPLGQDERDQRTSTFIQVGSLPPAILGDGREAQYAPSVAFRKLNPGEALIWHEAGNYVFAIPHESGEPLHCQALAARSLDADAGAEVRCILASLELAGLTPNLQSICLVALNETEEAVPESFANAVDLPVTLRKDEPPQVPTHTTRLVPASVVKWRHERQQRRMFIMGVMAFAFVLVAALGAFAARVLIRERSLLAEEKYLNSIEGELQSIRDARAAWDDMLPAITPDLYPVESLHQLVMLLPPDGIRMTKFEVREDGVVLDGQASSLGHGLQFRDKLMAAEAFKRWVWEFPSPTNLPDGQATFHAEGRPAEVVAEENMEVSQR